MITLISNFLESIKDPLSSTVHIKLQDENQNSNRNETKSTLKLTINPKSKELQLQIKDKKTLNKSEKSSSGQQNNGFCTICNTTPCKFQNGTPDTNEFVEGNSNIITITVSKNELCRTICNDSGNVASTSSTQKGDRGGEYCPLCDAPKCKLDNKSENNNEVNTEGQRSIENRTKTAINMSTNTDASDLIQIKVNKTEICRQICFNDNTDSSTREDTLTSSTSGNKHVDITKIPGYCSVCKLPQCKYEPNSKTTEQQRAIEYPSDTSSSSDSSSDSSSEMSDRITISVDKSEICRVICKDVDTFTQTDPTKNKEKTQTEPTENKEKTKEYCQMCNAPKCKLLKDKPIETSNKISRKNNVNFNSTYSTDNSTGRRSV